MILPHDIYLLFAALLVAGVLVWGVRRVGQRVSPRAERKEPSLEDWVAAFYPDARSSAPVIEVVLEHFASVTNVGPTQLRPNDDLTVAGSLQDEALGHEALGFLLDEVQRDLKERFGIDWQTRTASTTLDAIVRDVLDETRGRRRDACSFDASCQDHCTQPENSNRNQRPECGVDALSELPDDGAALRTAVGIGFATALVTASLVLVSSLFATGGAQDVGACCVWGPIPPCSGFFSGFLVGRKTGPGRLLVQSILANPVLYVAPCFACGTLSAVSRWSAGEDILQAASAFLFLLATSWAGTLVGLHSGSVRSKGTRGVACGACDYDLTGNVSGRCPECGTEIPPAQRAALGITADGSEADGGAGV